MVSDFVHILDINKKKENEVMSEVLIRSRVLSNGKNVYEYSFEIASDDGKRKRITKSGFKTKKAAKEEGRLAQQTYETSGVKMLGITWQNGLYHTNIKEVMFGGKVIYSK